MLRIHQALQAGGFPNASKLAREVEVSTKTIHRDIEFMRDRLNLPVEFDPGRNGYFYDGEVSGFPTMQITEGEIFALVVAEKALQQYRGTSFEKPLLSAIKKMEQALPDTISLNLADIEQTISFRTRAEPILDLEIFDPLAKAVAQRQQLELTLPQARPADRRRAWLMRIIWRTSTANGISSPTTMRARISALSFRRASSPSSRPEKLSSARRNFLWRNGCATVLASTPAKANLKSSSASTPAPPITSAKKNGMSRRPCAI